MPGPDALDLLHVVVPAHDEGELLPTTLASVSAATRVVRRTFPRVRVRCTVVLDACTDDSERVCRAARVDTVAVHLANVGAARRAGVELARTTTAAARVRPERTWVASTDADSLVPPRWLVDQVERAEAGSDVVLGRVEPDPTAPPAVLARWHELHDDGRVGVHGAHLGFRLSAYEAAGGWSPLAEREDLDLYQRLLASGARYGAAREIVMTSSRLVGRTGGGFAGFLARLHAEG